MTHRTSALALSLVLCAGAGSARAGGFLLNDHGAKATGRVDAVTATVTDGSAIFYNPAGVGAAEGTHVYAGGSLIVPDASFTEDSTGVAVSKDSEVAFTPNAYFHMKANDYVRFGLGAYTPFGSSVGWPEDAPWVDQLRSITLRTLFITPVIGLKLDRWVPGLSLGAGIDMVPASVELKRDIAFGDQIGTADLGGNTFGAGGRLGIMYAPKPIPGLSLGVAWRSEVGLHFDGNIDFNAPPPFRSQLPPDGPISTSIKLPQSILSGIAYTYKGFQLEADLQWVDWSVFKRIAIRLPDGSMSIDERDYKDAFTPRFGVEYAFAHAAVRAGYAYDPTPIRKNRLSVQLPDINRHVVSVGASLKPANNDSYVDIGILTVLPGRRHTELDPAVPVLQGMYKVKAIVFAISYGITLGGKKAGQKSLVAGH